MENSINIKFIKTKIIIAIFILVVFTIILSAMLYINEYYLREEAKKIIITVEDVEKEREYLKPIIATAHWAEACGYLAEYFETHSRTGEDAEVLLTLYEELSLLVQWEDIDPQYFSEFLSSFRCYETFISAMCYFPPSKKWESFMNSDSLVPYIPAEYTELVIHKQIPVDEETVEYLKFSTDDFADVERYEITMGGFLCEITLFKNTQGYYAVWDVTTEDENCYFFELKRWKYELYKLYMDPKFITDKRGNFNKMQNKNC